jgi:hypothetical protein
MEMGLRGGVWVRGEGQKGLWDRGSPFTAWDWCGGKFASLHKGDTAPSKGLLFFL